MYMKRAFLALAMCALSAFANASVSTAIVEAQYELSQSPSDLVVPSASVISFESKEDHTTALQVDKSEATKPERSHKAEFVMIDLNGEQLTVINEVGWRRSYNL